MLTLPIYLRGSSYYLHTRFLGKQFKKFLKTADKQTASIVASKIAEVAKMSIDLGKFTKQPPAKAGGFELRIERPDTRRLNDAS